MPKKPSKPRPVDDENQAAFNTMQRIVAKTEAHATPTYKLARVAVDPRKPEETKTVRVRVKDAAAVSLGRRGGLKGGKARAAKLSPQRRTEIARAAANKRWNSG